MNIECLHAGPLSFDIFPQALVIFDQGDGLVEYLRDNGVGAWRWPGDELPLEVKEDPDVFKNSNFF